MLFINSIKVYRSFALNKYYVQGSENTKVHVCKMSGNKSKLPMTTELYREVYMALHGELSTRTKGGRDTSTQEEAWPHAGETRELTNRTCVWTGRVK